MSVRKLKLIHVAGARKVEEAEGVKRRDRGWETWARTVTSSREQRWAWSNRKDKAWVLQRCCPGSETTPSSDRCKEQIRIPFTVCPAFAFWTSGL